MMEERVGKLKGKFFNICGAQMSAKEKQNKNTYLKDALQVIRVTIPSKRIVLASASKKCKQFSFVLFRRPAVS